MALRADFSVSYLRRYLMMAAIGLGWAAWCGYDGLVAYPKKYKLAEAYAELNGLDKKDRDLKWQEIATAKGWPLTAPKTAEEVRGSIGSQYAMGCLGLLVGIPALFYYFRSRGSWVERTPDGMTTSWGQDLPFDQVETLNKRKWKNKGIARATYKHEGGQKVFVFDDFKFDRKSLGRMLQELENGLRDDQILEGRREGDSIEESAVGPVSPERGLEDQENP